MRRCILVVAVDGKIRHLECRNDEDKERWLKNCEIADGVELIKEIKCSDDWGGRIKNE